ncbi:MAG: glycosyltransferase family 39 protein [Clostridiales bacterium]|nr:glycosyltransferase family 39 protein [Clostridiales bacterium]
MPHQAERWSRALGACALALFVLLMAALVACALTMTAIHGLDGPYEDSIRFVRDALPANLLLTGAALLSLVLGRALLERFARVHLSAILMGLWGAAAIIWVLGIGLVSETDCGALIMTARRFAQGDYALLSWGYYRGCPFQLGMVLLLEGLQRLFPGGNIDLMMQLINTVMSVLTMGVVCALAQRMEGSASASRACALLLALFLPFLLYNVYVYGTVLMTLMLCVSLLCFSCYVRTRRARYGAAMALALAVGYVAKPNILIAVVALLICAALDALRERRLGALLFVGLGLVLGLLMMKLVIWQYELRSGVRLEPNVCRLTWLVMGLSDRGIEGVCPGWYNGYVGEFFDIDITPEAQKAVVLADLKARIPELLDNPAYTAAYLRDKCLSQWIEPGYSTMSYGDRCDWQGRFNGVAALVYREDSPVRAALEAYMNVCQQALYVLALTGGLRLLRRGTGTDMLALPVTVLGGFLFHLLFEAKSQYIYPYAVLLMPMAAVGLEAVARGCAGLARRLEHRHETEA